MTALRRPEIAGPATFDPHHGVMVNVIFRGLKGEPIERMTFTMGEAAALAESLIRSVKQGLR